MVEDVHPRALRARRGRPACATWGAPAGLGGRRESNDLSLHRTQDVSGRVRAPERSTVMLGPRRWPSGTRGRCGARRPRSSCRSRPALRAGRRRPSCSSGSAGRRRNAGGGLWRPRAVPESLRPIGNSRSPSGCEEGAIARSAGAPAGPPARRFPTWQATAVAGRRQPMVAVSGRRAGGRSRPRSAPRQGREGPIGTRGDGQWQSPRSIPAGARHPGRPPPPTHAPAPWYRAAPCAR
jgi:hypothetical protein